MRKYIFITITIIMIISLGNLSFGNTKTINENVHYEVIEITKGDTLWEIANVYKDDNSSTSEYIAQIKDFNNMNTDVIKVGQSIIIPIKA